MEFSMTWNAKQSGEIGGRRHADKARLTIVSVLCGGSGLPV
jgi:hypothetical protein